MSVVRKSNTKLLDRLAKLQDGSVAIGFFAEDTYNETGIPVAQVAYKNEFGGMGEFGQIPRRPFLRRTIHEQEGNWARNAVKAFKDTEFDTDKAMGRIGESARGDVVQTIHKIASAGGNSPDTVARKGFDSPLIETGRMSKHVKSKVGFAV